MSGRGPAPKPSARRVRRNAVPAPAATLKLVRVSAPELPESVEWHPRTRDWWRTWADSELARDFTASDWSFLLDTALMHHAMWSKGQWTLAAEVRLRVAKFGATPEDRARLRIVFADADEKDDRRAERVSSRRRYGGLTAVGE
jgi:hypothetical protein